MDDTRSVEDAYSTAAQSYFTARRTLESLLLAGGRMFDDALAMHGGQETPDELASLELLSPTMVLARATVETRDLSGHAARLADGAAPLMHHARALAEDGLQRQVAHADDAEARQIDAEQTALDAITDDTLRDPEQLLDGPLHAAAQQAVADRTALTQATATMATVTTQLRDAIAETARLEGMTVFEPDDVS